MRTATCFTLVAVGAILAFAVTGHLSFLNVQVTGLIIMATGVAGFFLPAPGEGGWLRRRIVLRRGARGPMVGQVEETRYPPYVLNPGAPGPTGAEPVVWEEPEGSGPGIFADLAGGDVTVEHEDPIADQFPPAGPRVTEEYIEE